MILAEMIPHPRWAASAAEDELGLASEIEIGGPRLLVRLRHVADAELGHDRVLDRDIPELAFELIRRIVRPDVLDEGHRLGHHAVARMDVEVLEQLEVGHQPARPDPEHEAALAHVVELGGLGGDDRRVVIGQVDHRGPEREVAGVRHEAGEEHERRGDRLGGGGKMLAHPQLVEPESIGQQRLFGVLFERAPEQAVRRMDRHHEHSEAHAFLPADPAAATMTRRAFKGNGLRSRLAIPEAVRRPSALNGNTDASIKG